MEQTTVDNINRSSIKLSMVVTGGGSRFIGDFLSHSGGSNTILDFQVPYSEVAHEAYLQKDVEYKFVSEEAAYELAKAAYRKMQHCTDGDLLGVSVTASLIKDNEREGRENHFYVGIADYLYVHVYHIKVDKTVFTWRLAQEVQVSETVLNILENPEIYESKKFLRVHPDYSNIPQMIDLGTPTSFFIGTFNPIHDGHIGIYEDLKTRFDNVIFEISKTNRDKPSVDENDIQLRLFTDENWKTEYDYVITQYKLIIDKILYFNKILGFEKVNIAMGTDTWNRFIKDSDTTYDHMNYILERCEGVSFTVYNRGENWSENTVFDNYGFDVKYVDYDVNMSSTEIRERKALTEQQKPV